MYMYMYHSAISFVRCFRAAVSSICCPGSFWFNFCNFSFFFCPFFASYLLVYSAGTVVFHFLKVSQFYWVLSVLQVWYAVNCTVVRFSSNFHRYSPKNNCQKLDYIDVKSHFQSKTSTGDSIRFPVVRHRGGAVRRLLILWLDTFSQSGKM